MRLNINHSNRKEAIKRFWPPAVPRRLALGFFLALMLLVALDLPAQPKSSNRYLFIVETSAPMKRQVEDITNVVNEILFSAASGQLHPGDSLGLWTYNEEVYSELPSQTWIAEDRALIAQRIDVFLKQQNFHKTGHWEKVAPDLANLIKNSDILTVFLISTGEGKMIGTPFDKEINAQYADARKEMKSHHRAVVTVLQAKGGKVIHYTVNALPWPVVIPELPIQVIAPAAVAPANHPAPTPNPAPPVNQNPAPHPVPRANVPAKIVPAFPPLSTNHNPALAAQPENRRLPPAATMPAKPPAMPLLPNTPPNLTTPTPANLPANMPVVAPQVAATAPRAPVSPTALPPQRPPDMRPPMNAPVTPIQPPVNPATGLPIQQAVNGRPPVIAPSASKPMAIPRMVASGEVPPPPSFDPASLPNAPRTGPAQKPPVNNVASNSSAAKVISTNSLGQRAFAFLSPNLAGRSNKFLAAGLALLAVAMLLILVMVRRARSSSGPSLITQSMNDPEK